MTTETFEETHEADPLRAGQRRVREGELHYVADDLSPAGWTIVEIAGEGDQLAAFAIGQVEAIPLDELDGRFLGPVCDPPRHRRAA